MSSVYTELMAENAQLRAENAALRCAMEAIRTLTGMIEIPAVAALNEPTPAPAAVKPTPPAAPVRATMPAEPDAQVVLRFLRDMKEPELAPRAPKLKRNGKYLPPFWMPKPAPVTDIVQHSPFLWKPAMPAETIPLDRSGAHVSSAAAVEVAFGQLEQVAEPIMFDGAPGFYKAAWAPWTETGLPHPLGPAADQAERDGHVWVPHTRVKLLADLAVQGRWPELGRMDAWINEHRARMTEWAGHVNELRAMMIDQYGRDSDEYGQVKEAFSMSLSLMSGSKLAGQPRTWQCDVRRPDWTYAIRDLSACTMWRWADDLAAVARDHGRPEWAVIGIQNQDELVIVADALELFTTANRRPLGERGKPRRPVRLDPTGKTLGTFKVKP